MSFTSEMRTPEQRTKKMLNEERIIIDLELAVKKAKFRKTQQKNDSNRCFRCGLELAEK
jgi:hypothetical protein